MDADESDERRPKRVRRAVQVASEAGTSRETDRASTTSRPTPAELQEAKHVIQQMKQMKPPLLAKRAPAQPNVVACALALQRGEHFADDRAALRLFGAHPETKVQELWVNGKLAQFAPAGVGMGTPGLALPAYLLERGESAERDERAAALDSGDSSDDSSGDESSRAERKMERHMPVLIAQEDERWAREQRESAACARGGRVGCAARRRARQPVGAALR